MKTRLISSVIGAALMASTSAFANHSFGRDSVYAMSGANTGTQQGALTVKTRDGRASVYAYDLPAPTRKDAVKITVVLRPGRS